MSIIRVKKDKNNPYLIMNKTCLDDIRLSLKAKGLLCFLLSKPDNWYINTTDIVSCSSNGIDSVWSAIRELVKYGYMYRHRFRTSNGSFHSYNYLVYEHPRKSLSETSVKSPHRENPSVVNPSLDNPLLLINKTKKVIKSSLTTLSNKPNITNVAQDDIIQKEFREETSHLLNELYIKNHKILFDSFDDIDIFWYADWMLTFKTRIKNPTGFIISALRERWLDINSYLKQQYNIDKDSD